MEFVHMASWYNNKTIFVCKLMHASSSKNEVLFIKIKIYNNKIIVLKSLELFGKKSIMCILMNVGCLDVLAKFYCLNFRNDFLLSFSFWKSCVIPISFNLELRFVLIKYSCNIIQLHMLGHHLEFSQRFQPYIIHPAIFVQ